MRRKYFYEISDTCVAVIKTKLPPRWHIIEGTLTQPRGTVWIANNEPLFIRVEGKLKFNKKRKHCLLFKDKKSFLAFHSNDKRFKVL